MHCSVLLLIYCLFFYCLFFFFKQKTAYEMRISDWSSDVCSSDLGEQISLQRAVTIEDFSVKMPQLAGGVNSTSVGSDAFGAQTLDLRNLGQNRTLVLIKGTRAIPFSFRNAVDVNSIPEPLLKRVDVLTGGAADVRSEEHTSELQALMRRPSADF